MDHIHVFVDLHRAINTIIYGEEVWYVGAIRFCLYMFQQNFVLHWQMSDEASAKVRLEKWVFPSLVMVIKSVCLLMS